MEETQVISVRLPKSLIRELDKIIIDWRYYRRNTIISQVLKVFVACADKQTVYDTLRWWDHSGDKYKLTLRKIEPKTEKEISRETPAV